MKDGVQHPPKSFSTKEKQKHINAPAAIVRVAWFPRTLDSPEAAARWRHKEKVTEKEKYLESPGKSRHFTDNEERARALMLTSQEEQTELRGISTRGTSCFAPKSLRVRE